MVHVKSQGNFDHLRTYLKSIKEQKLLRILDEYGKKGVLLLIANTPNRSGLTAQSWYYYIQRNGSGYDLVWANRNTKDGVNIAVLLQYGHATGTGGYVPSVDYINPALRPLMRDLVDQMFKEVSDI